MKVRTSLMIGNATAALATVATVALGYLTMAALGNLNIDRLRDGSQIDEVTAIAAAVAGTAIAAWYALSAIVSVTCLVARSTGAMWVVGEQALRRRGAPGMARLVSAGAGAVLAASFLAGPAHATPAPPALEPAASSPSQRVAPDDLGWAATPNQPAQTSPAEPAEPTRPAPERTGHPDRSQEQSTPDHINNSAGATYEVQVGDSLWSIAEDHLPDGASTAEIATAWPEWYEANSDAIGADPNLIHPGAQLHAPTDDEA